MPSRIGDHLKVARRHHFVGRDAEKAFFRTTLAAAEPPFYVLYIFGPGGVGKTALLHEFSLLAQEAQMQTIYIDARNIEPSPDSFITALTLAIGLTPPTNPLDVLMVRSQRTVIMIDTSEALVLLESWLRDTFLPQLPANILIIFAGRNPPAAAWRADPGWQSLLHLLPLRNLTPEESRTYLGLRTIAPIEHTRIAEFTHGHPLAISLVADLLEQRPSVPFEPDTAPDVVRALLEQFVQETPTAAHRLALEACALVRYMTEGLLAEMVNLPDAHALFDWLRGLSFIDSGRLGLFPHDLVREALTTDLRWRYPDRYIDLHARARAYYTARLHHTTGANQRRILTDFIFLHRDNAVVRPIYAWQDTGDIWTDPMQAAEIPSLLELVRQYEGENSAQLAAHWFECQPHATLVIRDRQRHPLGMLTQLALHEASRDQLAADPATRAAWAYLQRHAPIRPGEIVTYFRFWLDKEAYQAVSLVQSRIFINCVQHYLTTPNLAYTLFACAEPDFWADVFGYADLIRLPDADFKVDGRSYGVYGHDWRVTPPAKWLELLAEREITLIASAPPTRSQPLLVLSQPGFAEAVRDALRQLTHPNELQNNPLLHSRLVEDRVGNEAPLAERVVALQALIKEAAKVLQDSPRQAKLYRALYHTYFQPAATQELAAEVLDVPFSSYRRHLKAGVDEVVDYLWNRELGNVIS
ncbi:ATP-binding protein [soil metagenome]